MTPSVSPAHGKGQTLWHRAENEAQKESLEIRKRAEKGEVRRIGQEGAGMRQRAGEGRISQRHREKESEVGTKR